MALPFMRAAKRHMTHSDMSLPTRSPETPDSESRPQCVQCYCTASASTRHVWNRMVATLTVPGTVCAGTTNNGVMRAMPCEDSWLEAQRQPRTK